VCEVDDSTKKILSHGGFDIELISIHRFGSIASELQKISKRSEIFSEPKQLANPHINLLLKLRHEVVKVLAW
jgi:hypothetical protein